MSLPVAIQSAIFYIVACTPCAKARHRQKTKTQARKEREEKAKLETEQPGLYRHPSPFNTNPYWEAEISIGPSLPKKSASKNSSQRGLTSGHTSIAPSVSEHTNIELSRTNVAASTNTIPQGDGLADDWNKRHGYQREDEELWGQWSSHMLKDARDVFSKAKDSAGRLIDATLGIEKEVTEQERREFYFTARAPPVNDYHPPVVSSKAPNRNAHRWMLQPPPPAKIMEGKVPVSRAASSGSKSSGMTLVSEEAHLSRVLSEKIIKEKRSKEKNMTESELIDSLFIDRDSRSLSFTRGRSLSLGESDETLDMLEMRRSGRLRPAAVPPGFESEDPEEEDDIDMPRPRSETTERVSMPTHAAQRPRLETILSAESAASSRRSSRRSKTQQSNTFPRAVPPVGYDLD